MTSTVTQWHEYNTAEKIAWLCHNVLRSENHATVDSDYVRPEYDGAFIGRCEAELSPSQRTTYIKYISSAIAEQTYAGMTDAETQLESTSELFYWNYMRAPVDLRGRCLWNVVAKFAP
jgi:hypothetical protein